MNGSKTPFLGGFIRNSTNKFSKNNLDMLKILKTLKLENEYYHQIADSQSLSKIYKLWASNLVNQTIK